MRRAICFGINEYPDPSHNLNGCVNDANGWSNLFTKLKFDHVEIYLNEDVTRRSFVDNCVSLLTVSKPGDLLVITYSGHGTQVYDYSGDEEDGYDEALFLYDGALIDDKLRALINTYAPIGFDIVFILDSCFSGTATRKVGRGSINLGKPRFIPAKIMTSTATRNKAFLEGSMTELLMSGSSDNQYSYDANFNGEYYGAFTHAALRAFEKGGSYQEWHQNILDTIEHPQTPQLEGSTEFKNKLALGVSIDDAIDDLWDDDNFVQPVSNKFNIKKYWWVALIILAIIIVFYYIR